MSGPATTNPADGDIGVPSGTARLALAWASRGAAAAGSLTGVAYAVDDDRVLAHLLLPLLVGDHLPGMPPRPAPGGGFVQADLIDEDEPLYATLAAAHPQADAEALAVLAQECRLPVAPYRTLNAAGGRGVAGSAGAGVRVATTAAPANGARTSAVHRLIAPGDVTVVDLTTMWAGPLCTMMLAGWGATVVTVEPAARPDGLRGAPRQFAALDHGKHRVDLDLRTRRGRAAFEQLVAAADVVIESFSPRVMANFAYRPSELRRMNPRVVTLSMRAFPAAAPEREWVGYGRGAHAASGLGMLRGVPQRARFAYPDPLAGLAAFATVLDVLGRSDPPAAVEISLAEVIAPLTAGGERPLPHGEPTLLGRLRDTVGIDPGSPIVPAAR